MWYLDSDYKASVSVTATVFVILAFSFVRLFFDLEVTLYSLCKHSRIR